MQMTSVSLQALKPLHESSEEGGPEAHHHRSPGVSQDQLRTSLLHQYVHKTFYEDYQTTLGASILSKIIILDDTTLKLQIWDTGGQERFRSMVSTFYKGSDGCILAFDVTDLESFEALDTWRGDVLAKTIPMEPSYPMVVLGNKIDLADRQVSQEVAQGWCKEKDIPYFEVSAKNDINVVQAFEMLASRALSRVSGYGGVMCQLPPEDRKLGGFQ
ncbi:RAB7B protein, partial [Crocuta crocuta]